MHPYYEIRIMTIVNQILDYASIQKQPFRRRDLMQFLATNNVSDHQSLISSHLSKTRKKTVKFAKFLQIFELSFWILTFDLSLVVIPPIPNPAKEFRPQ